MSNSSDILPIVHLFRRLYRRKGKYLVLSFVCQGNDERKHVSEIRCLFIRATHLPLGRTTTTQLQKCTKTPFARKSFKCN